MAGSSSKRKSGKGKTRSTSTSDRVGASAAHTSSPYYIPDAFFDDIDGADTWRALVEVLCAYLDLPDLSTRSGLKKVHARFPEYFKKLDTHYVTAQRRGNIRLMGGIVGVWAKMCADAILRDKLFQEGLLSKVMPLLEFDSTRHVALQALSTVTHHGGVIARKEIARRNPTLVKLINDHSNDPKVLELVIVTMAHSTNAVLGVDDVPDPGLVKEIAVKPVLEATMMAIRDPKASHYLVDHAMGLLTCATRHCPKDSASVPGLLPLLVGFLRSSNLSARCNALGGLIRFTAEDSEPDKQHFDPHKMIAAVSRRFPDNLSEVMMKYGPEKCDTVLTLKSTGEYQQAMMRCAQDHDLVALGQSLATLIQRTEFAIAEGSFRTEGPNGTWRDDFDLGLPFKMWTDALPHCAKALRERNAPGDLDMADIVELKYFIIRSRIPDAISGGQRAIARNPNLAYAYYAISMGADHAEGLRAVKKGLKCKNLTPFVRNYLLWRAVEHAGDLGVMTLQESKAGDRDHSEGVAFLMSAWEDAKTFVAEAPPDNRHMQTIINWYIILQLAIKGPELSEDLKELSDVRRKLEVSTQMLTFLGHTIKRTQMRLARELILNLYPTSVPQWRDFVQRFDEMDARNKEHVPIPAKETEDNLAAWLDNLKLEDGEEDGPHLCTHPRINTNNVMLYRCSWCANPSAVLRKCSGCGKTRYCDSGCQKQHWPEHKAACKAGRS